MTYKYFFFDFDGMLCDSYSHIATAFCKALSESRNQKISFTEAYDCLKINFNEAYSHFKITAEEKKLFKKYHENFDFKPYPTLYLPIKKILQTIIDCGGKNFIYTNRGESLFEYLKRLGIDSYFTDYIISANKPDPEVLNKMITKYNLDKKECVVVGDRSLDVLGAFNANVDGILYDEDSRVFLHKATHVIKHLGQLYNFIDNPYKIKHNYHTHTARCGHAIGSDEEYIISAIKAGYQTLGFSDHIIIPDVKRNEEYFDTISLLKEKYKQQIDIKIALEVEYYPYYLPLYKKYLEEGKVDYLIFGNHGLIGENEKDRKNQIVFIEPFEDDSYLDLYYDCLKKAIDTKMFKYIAHPDCFLKGYGKWDEKAIALTHKIAQLLEGKDLYAELSGSGYRSRKKVLYNGEIYPAYPFKEFYKILSQYDIKFVMGCDAHSPEQLDDEAVNYLQDLAKELNLNVVYKLDF